MNNENIINQNKKYWNEHANFWFGTTALPEYGVKFVTENELHFFEDVAGKKVLEICCGSGHSLKYLADRKAAELWGLDLSKEQLAHADEYLKQNGYQAKLICAAMEEDAEIPTDYFDYVYSIYGIGWTTDLPGTFRKIASYLKKDGTFIFSWHHTLHYCVAWSCEERDVIEEDQLILTRSYFDESYFKMPVHDSEIILCNRKISTYINALAEAGFVIEQMVEQNDRETMEHLEDMSTKARIARMCPISMCFRARKR